ncbi:kinetochore protein Spc25 [Cyprinodon tularosa]|uniref:Kinetochore protein SPC25 n=1 Tax=Cyprinodon variegatus TaxID=28743 RepID=A0A3Q2C9C7_CYPVA|nr:PREDICTED: kinetochore protein Spc25 [Cyprinodon variegatus]XP_038136179.1 kinetochore protein Spc25 [Cyprinodon tularosa]
MASITDPNLGERITAAMEEFRNKQLKLCADITEKNEELCHNNRHLLKSALDTCLKKCEEDEKLFEMINEFKMDLEKKKMVLKEKRHAISETISEVQEKEMQKEDLILKIQKLKEEQIKRKEVIDSQNRANKDKLKNLQKARLVFQNHLGLEIRTIMDKSQSVRGEKLQFIFRNISLSDPDNAYVITMGMKENRTYQIVSSDPVLENLPVLESRLQETNNLAAFLANVRKEFISKART